MKKPIMNTWKERKKMKHGCSNCQNCRCYPSNSYWDPDEYECVGFDEMELDKDISETEWEEIIDRCWTNDEQWDDEDDPICPAYVQEVYDYGE